MRCLSLSAPDPLRVSSAHRSNHRDGTEMGENSQEGLREQGGRSVKEEEGQRLRGDAHGERRWGKGRHMRVA